MFGHQDGQVGLLLCVFFSPSNVSNHPPDPSTSNTNLEVSEDSREKSVDEEDQLCPDDPERLKQQQQPECGEALNTEVTFHFNTFMICQWSD